MIFDQLYIMTFYHLNVRENRDDALLTATRFYVEYVRFLKRSGRTLRYLRRQLYRQWREIRAQFRKGS